MPERHIGRNLGRYRVDALLGSGGFAWVYRGFDPDLEIPVALKVLKPQFAGDPEFEERFRREASTAARLRHPNIVTIYAVGREDDAVYFAMDYLPQGLAQRLEVSSSLPEQILLRLGMEVSRALGFAHRAGVVHRDIKVDNILFDEHGNAIVVDFGIARAVADAAKETKTNMVVGTPQYFAPEQARGHAVDGRTDIYALGVTLFRAATGRLPFDGEDWYAVARQHVEGAPPAPRGLNAALSEGFEAIILRCLEKRPDDRFQTADDLADSLAGLAGTNGNVGTMPTVSVPTFREPATERMLSTLRRRRALLGAGVIALSAATAIIILAARPEPMPPSDVTPPARQFTLQPPLLVPPPDSVADSTFIDRDPARPRGAVLHVSAPGAQILIDGRRAGSNEFRADTMAPGTYRITARVASIANCRWSTDEQTVSLSSNSARTVELTPQACGRVRFARVPMGTHYRLAGPGSMVFEGVVPMDGPIVVPAVRYTVVLNRSGCEQFGPEQLDVPPATDQREEHVEYWTLSCREP